jgi:NADPH oxidase
LEAQCLPRGVLRLQFAMPDSFTYTAGQYITLKCDNLNEEWHPFTICSAPEEGFLELYIRSSDELDWCSALRKATVPIKDYWKNGNKKPVKYDSDDSNDWRFPRDMVRNLPDLRGHSGVDLKTVDKIEPQLVESIKLASLPEPGVDDDKRPIILRIDGPFGAPAEAVWTYQTVMLVGAGIGVTPFASILRSWCLKSDAMRKMGTRECRPTRLHFYWVCRGIEEFNWFEDLLIQSLKGPGKNAFEFNLFATGECKYSEVSDSRLVKSLKGQTYFGRPNWKRIFGDLKTKHGGQHIGCFLCGPEAIRSQLVTAAGMFSDDNVRFSVHAESF